MAKSSQAEKSKRIAEVVSMLSASKQTQDILEYARKHWNISDSQTYIYIKEATDQIEQYATMRVELSLDWGVRKRTELYRDAKTAKQYNVCNSILNDLSKLSGHYREDNKQKQANVILSIDGKSITD